MAHTFQLSVKSALSSKVVRQVLTHVRETAKYLRKSAEGAIYLEQVLL